MATTYQEFIDRPIAGYGPETLLWQPDLHLPCPLCNHPITIPQKEWTVEEILAREG